MVAPREMSPMDLHPDDPRTLAARLTVLEAQVMAISGMGSRDGELVARVPDQAELDRVGPWPDAVLAKWKERQSR